ncbi:hypothetical protein OSB04_003328 [Centaurea solstitialis]|uniref:Uncharacterized protein n=1 Tax=Centaurea solstitialis TaxID=347529 RepID=A0AA38WN41_9ASTR|nr:hypothetical protein OSB04_003328 [Centaurea solstitialis]
MRPHGFSSLVLSQNQRELHSSTAENYASGLVPAAIKLSIMITTNPIKDEREVEDTNVFTVDAGFVNASKEVDQDWIESISSPIGLTIDVVPKELKFNRLNEKLAFKEMELESNSIICLVGRNVRWNLNSDIQNDRITLLLFLCRSGSGGSKRRRRSAVGRKGGGGRWWVEVTVGGGSRGWRRSAVGRSGGGGRRWVEAVAAVGGGSKRWRRSAVGRSAGGGRRWVEAVAAVGGGLKQSSKLGHLIEG